MNGIEVKSRLIVRRGDALLLERRADAAGHGFYRPLGGKVELGETSRSAAAREFHEETGLQADDLRYLGCLEDIRIGPEAVQHEICFVYEGTVRDRCLFEADSIALREQDRTYTAFWRTVDDLDLPLRPADLRSLLRP